MNEDNGDVFDGIFSAGLATIGATLEITSFETPVTVAIASQKLVEIVGESTIKISGGLGRSIIRRVSVEGQESEQRNCSSRN